MDAEEVSDVLVGSRTATSGSSPTATCARGGGRPALARRSGERRDERPGDRGWGDQTGADVMLTMLDHDIRHVPVFSSPWQPLGSSSPSISSLRRPAPRSSCAGRSPGPATRASFGTRPAELRSTVVALHRAERSALPRQRRGLGRVRCPDRRMIELAIESAGPPPAEFAWMSLGSHGRREPMPSSDVDSGMAWRRRHWRGRPGYHESICPLPPGHRHLRRAVSGIPPPPDRRRPRWRAVHRWSW